MLLAIWLFGSLPPPMLPPRRHCDHGFAIGAVCELCEDGSTADECRQYGLKRKDAR